MLSAEYKKGCFRSQISQRKPCILKQPFCCIVQESLSFHLCHNCFECFGLVHGEVSKCFAVEKDIFFS